MAENCDSFNILWLVFIWSHANLEVMHKSKDVYRILQYYYTFYVYSKLSLGVNNYYLTINGRKVTLRRESGNWCNHSLPAEF